MDTATITMALMVLTEGSVRGAARKVGRAPSTVADAFERFERDLAMTLGVRSEGGFSLTVAGETLVRSSPPLLLGLAQLAAIAGAEPDEALPWTARFGISVPCLSHYVAVVRAGSLRRAARSLGITQPYISRQISGLEDRLGVSLLQRGKMGCEPTIAGETLVGVASTMLAELSSLTLPANRRFARTQRTVKLGTIIPLGHESRLASRLAKLVHHCRQDNPPQDLLVSSTTAEDLIAGLRSGRFDIALIDTKLTVGRYRSVDVIASELVLVGRRDIICPNISLQDVLRTNPIAVPSTRSGLRQSITAALDNLTQDWAQPELSFVEVDALSIILNLVFEYGYLSVLPLDAVHSLGDAINILPLPGAPSVTFHLTWPQTNAMKALVERIHSHLTE